MIKIFIGLFLLLWGGLAGPKYLGKITHRYMKDTKGNPMPGKKTYTKDPEFWPQLILRCVALMVGALLISAELMGTERLIYELTGMR